MRGDRHLKIERGSPEPIVLRRGIAAAIGQTAEQDAFQTELLAMLHLGDGVLGVGDRHDAHADQAVGGNRTVFLGEPIVVAADHRFVDLVVGDVAPEHRAGDHRREQHLGVDTVLVLLLDPLFRATGAGGIGDLETKGLPGAFGAAGAQIEEIGFEQWLTLDHQGVPAIRQVHRVRGAVAVFFRDAMEPSLRRHFEVPVARHQIVAFRHGYLLRPGISNSLPCMARAGRPLRALPSLKHCSVRSR